MVSKMGVNTNKKWAQPCMRCNVVLIGYIRILFVAGNSHQTSNDIENSRIVSFYWIKLQKIQEQLLPQFQIRCNLI